MTSGHETKEKNSLDSDAYYEEYLQTRPPVKPTRGKKKPPVPFGKRLYSILMIFFYITLIALFILILLVSP